MKNKIIPLLLIVALIILFLPKTVLATTKEFNLFSVDIPDTYEEIFKNVSDTAENLTYKRIINNQSTLIMFNVFPNRLSNKYTQEELEDSISLRKKNYENNNDYTLISLTGKLTELNGLKGYYIEEYSKKKSTGEIHAKVSYVVTSDNYCVYITISSGKSFIRSSEYNKIIKSFKIKDTVLKNTGLPYVDVPSNAWYYDEVKYVYSNKIITGYNSYTFGPNDKITRAMVVTILYRMDGNPSVTGNSKFTDVKQNVWYSNAIKWATDKGIVHGYNSEKFGPNDNISRQDLMVILRNYAKYKKKNINTSANLSKYSDSNKVASYAKTAVEWAVGNQILLGSNNKLNPQGTATRAETAAFIQRYCNKIGK